MDSPQQKNLLTSAVLQAINGMEGLSLDLRALARQNRRLKMGLVAVAISIAVCIVVSIGVYRVSADQYVTQQDQQISRTRVLCPLYSIFLGAYRPELQPAEQRAGYEQAYTVIRDGYGALKCTQS